MPLCPVLRIHFAINYDSFSVANRLTGRCGQPYSDCAVWTASMNIAFSMRRYSRYLSRERRTTEFGLSRSGFGYPPSAGCRHGARPARGMSPTHSRIDLIDVFVFSE